MSIGLPKLEALLAQLPFDEILFVCSDEDSDLEVGAREVWAPGQPAAAGCQGPERTLVHEPSFPGFMRAVSQASAMVCALGRTEHVLGISLALSSQVFPQQQP